MRSQNRNVALGSGPRVRLPRSFDGLGLGGGAPVLVPSGRARRGGKSRRDRQLEAEERGGVGPSGQAGRAASDQSWRPPPEVSE